MDRIAAAFFVAVTLGATPQPPAFEFSAPPGWVRSAEGQVTVFRPPAEPPGTVVLWVMPPMARQPDFGGQVEALRAALASGAGLSRMRDVEERRDGTGGKEQRSHLATYSGGGGDVVLSIQSRAEGTSVGTVVFLATSAEAYQRLRPQAARVFDGMRLPGAAAGATPVAGPARPGGFRGPGISGVWMGFIMLMGSYEMPLRWKTFFDDGVMFADLPEDGLLTFDRASSQVDPDRAHFWHTYTFSGSRGETHRVGTSARWVLQLQTPVQMKIDSDTFHRCASVDGLRLEGAWTSYANPDDPGLDRLAVGQRPVIRFGRDARFIDEGLFAVFMRSHSGGDDRPGSGRYELRDFTLVLRYDDGRERHEAFTGFLSADPARADERIYVRRTPLFKRTGR